MKLKSKLVLLPITLSLTSCLPFLDQKGKEIVFKYQTLVDSLSDDLHIFSSNTQRAYDYYVDTTFASTPNQAEPKINVMAMQNYNYDSGQTIKTTLVIYFPIQKSAPTYYQCQYLIEGYSNGVYLYGALGYFILMNDINNLIVSFSSYQNTFPSNNQTNDQEEAKFLSVLTLGYFDVWAKSTLKHSIKDYGVFPNLNLTP